MVHRRLLRSAVLASLGALASMALSPGCGSDVERLECVGEQCDLVCPEGDASCEATCSKGADCDLDCNGADCSLDCQSKSECDADCTVAGGCDASCEGQSTCNVDCTESEGCDLDCAGGSTCDIKCSGDCGGGCQGTSQCSLTCEQGCGMGCTGDAICSLTCETGCFICCQGSADCTLTCGEGVETTECMVDENTRIIVCGRECPDASECDYGEATTTEEPEPPG